MTQNTPKYIKQVPWYAKNNQGQGQTINTPKFEPKSHIQQFYVRGQRGFQASTFRKGACQNCGGQGHNKKECTERPRKIGAKYTNQKIAPDDVPQNLQLDWEGKRDRWNGFQPEMYKQVIDEHNQFQEIRKKHKLNEGQFEDDKEFRKQQNPLQLANLPTKHMKNQKHQGLGGVRNRQQRAKYLNTLDLNGPSFDPKSRAMKGQQTLNNAENIGQKADLQEQISFATQQHEKHHAQLSSVGLPTLTEKIYKSVKERGQNLNNTSHNIPNQILKKYVGNNSSASNNLQNLKVYEQNDEQFELNATMMSNLSKKIIKSKYQQNVFINDHTSVWGSWYSKILGWGYQCCYSTDKMSYCMGLKGKQKTLARQLKRKAEILRQNGEELLMEENQIVGSGQGNNKQQEQINNGIQQPVQKQDNKKQQEEEQK